MTGRHLKLRVCVDCGDRKMVPPYPGGGLPERCRSCSKKRWSGAFGTKSKKRAA